MKHEEDAELRRLFGALKQAGGEYVSPERRTRTRTRFLNAIAQQSNNPNDSTSQRLGQQFGIHPGFAVAALVLSAIVIVASIPATALLEFRLLKFMGEHLAFSPADEPARRNMEKLVDNISLILLSAVGAIAGYIAYKVQRRWYHDEKKPAVVKAVIVALAIPLTSEVAIAVPFLLFLFGGIVGFIHIIRTRRR